MKKTHKHWSVNHPRALKTQKMYGGGELQGRGLVTGTVTECQKRGQLEGIGVEWIAVYPGKTVQRHIHYKSEAFLIVVKGRGEVILNRKTIRVAVGDVVSIPAETIHGLVTKQSRLELIAIQRPALYQPGKKEDFEIVE